MRKARSCHYRHEVQEKAKLKWLGFETPEEGLGEKFHISPKLLAELNPGKKLDTVGERITVPNVRRAAVGLALRVVVSKSKRTVIAYGAGGKELAQYPATIGDSHDPLPIGHWTIVGIVHYPWFNWDPKLLWNADPKTGESGTRAGSEQSRRRCMDRPLERGLWNPWDAGSGEYRARRIGRVYPADELGCG